MKERHWTSLVTSLRHGQCVLMLGQEGSATPAEADRAGSRNDESFAKALMRQLADELEEDGRRVMATRWRQLPSNMKTLLASAPTHCEPGRRNSTTQVPSHLLRCIVGLPPCRSV